MLAARRLKKRSLLEVNEHFSDKADDIIPYNLIRSTTICCQKGSYMLDARRLKKRSLLEVNEHFSGKADDIDGPLSQQIILCPQRCHPPPSEYDLPVESC